MLAPFLCQLMGKVGAPRLKGFVYHTLLRRRLAPARVPAAATHAQGMEVGDPIQFNSKAGMDQFFDDRSRVQEYLGRERIKFYQMVKRRISCHEGERILDIGCGPATLLKMLRAEYGVSAIGLDHSETAGRWVRTHYPDVGFLVGDIYHLPFAPGCVDVIIATEVLEHLLYPARAIEAALPLLRPGGRFFATVPDGRVDTFIGHINFWSYESFNVFAEPFGAKVERFLDGSLAMTLTR